MPTPTRKEEITIDELVEYYCRICKRKYTGAPSDELLEELEDLKRI